MTTASILQSARNFAHEILHPLGKQEESCGGSASESDVKVVHHHHYRSGYWGWHSHPIFIGDVSSPSTGRKKENSSLSAIIAVAAVVILVSSYCIGSELGRRWDISDHKQILEDQEQMLQTSDEPRKDRIVKVLEVEKRMLDTMHSQSLSGLMTKTTLLISGLAALSGALANSPVLVTIATASGAASLGSTLIHWGYCDADTSVKEDAVRLLNEVNLAEAGALIGSARKTY